MHKFIAKIRLALVVASIPVLVTIPSKVGLSQFPPTFPEPPVVPSPPTLPEPPVVPPFAAAKAQISGPGITGTVWMVQTPVFVAVNVFLQGDPKILTPGLHGIHIHEKGSCQASDNPAFTSAGGHLDPGPSGDSTIANHPYHTGDLANIPVNASGVGILKTISTRFSLSQGLLSLFDSDGSAIIVKQLPDQMKAGGTLEESGGDRIACGVIEAIPNPK